MERKRKTSRSTTKAVAIHCLTSEIQMFGSWRCCSVLRINLWPVTLYLSLSLFLFIFQLPFWQTTNEKMLLIVHWPPGMYGWVRCACEWLVLSNGHSKTNEKYYFQFSPRSIDCVLSTLFCRYLHWYGNDAPITLATYLHIPLAEIVRFWISNFFFFTLHLRHSTRHYSPVLYLHNQTGEYWSNHRSFYIQ